MKIVKALCHPRAEPPDRWLSRGFSPPNIRQPSNHSVDHFDLPIDPVADTAPHNEGDVLIEFYAQGYLQGSEMAKCRFSRHFCTAFESYSRHHLAKLPYES